MSIVVQGQKPDGSYDKVQLDTLGRLLVATEQESFSASSITYYPAAALTWETVTPATAMSKLTILNAATDKYLLLATEKYHKAVDSTVLTATVPATAGALLYALAIEMQLDQNTHVASTALHKVAGAPIYPVHKIPDVTNTCGAAADNDSTDVYVLANDLIDQIIAHIGSTTHHVTATATITHTDATTEETATTLVNLIRTSLIAHLGTGTNALHGGVQDTVNSALAVLTTAATNAATNKTLVNLLRTYYLAHLALGGPATNEATAVAQVNAVRVGLLAHYASTAAHYAADAANLALVTATSACTDAATALTLVNALYPPYLAHHQFLQREKYAASVPAYWVGQTPIYVAIESAGGFTVRTES
jgi:hypothetical protein